MFATQMVAQVSSPQDRLLPGTAIQPERSGQAGPTSPAQGSAPAPLNLRGGAVPTGLSGFYDYQSNGMSPGYLMVSPANPNHIHTTMMVATDGSDATTISNSRRVGYAYSSDGGANWSSNPSITEYRLGYPYLQLFPDNTVVVGAHGDSPPGTGLRVLFYVGATEGDINLIELGGTELETASGRTDGVIWPAFVVSPSDPSKLVTIGSLTAPTGTGSAPLQVTTFDINEGFASPWKDIASDSLIAATSGGRYLMARSAGGKIGVAYHHFANSDDDLETPGIWFTESSDAGATWSAPALVMGPSFTEEYMNNDDQDTVSILSNLDMAYRGETAHIVSTGATGGPDGQLYRTFGIYHWTEALGAQRIVVADSTIGLGVQTAVSAKAQPNMSYVSYPTVSIGNSGQHVAVAFQAAAQYTTDDGSVRSEEGFSYYRIWGVASRDGGLNWGDPFIIQDFAGDGTDSANIDYPSANEISRVDENGNLTLDLTFQARRSPGMYAFTVTNADPGPINETFQYFQRMTITPQMMGAPASVSTGRERRSVGSMKIYPSQASSYTTVDYSLTAGGPISIRLYNSLGDEVMVVAQAEAAAAGHYTKSINVGSLPAGIYRCVLQQAGATISTPLSVVR